MGLESEPSSCSNGAHSRSCLSFSSSRSACRAPPSVPTSTSLRPHCGCLFPPVPPSLTVVVPDGSFSKGLPPSLASPVTFSTAKIIYWPIRMLQPDPAQLLRATALQRSSSGAPRRGVAGGFCVPADRADRDVAQLAERPRLLPARVQVVRLHRAACAHLNSAACRQSASCTTLCVQRAR